MFKCLTMLFGSSPQLTGDQACFLLGYRFAHAASACVEGLCSNILETRTGHIVPSPGTGYPIACASAVGTANDFLRDHSSTCCRRDHAAQLARSEVIPSLKLLVFGASVPSIALLAGLEKLDEWALREAARDWRQWRSVTVPAFFESPVGESLIEVVQIILARWQRASMLPNGANTSMVAVVQFVFDFTAITGRRIVPDVVAESLSDSIAAQPHMYGPDHRLGVRVSFTVPVSVPVDTEALIEISRDIEYLSTVSAGPTMHALNRLAILVSQWTLSSSQALLAEQIRSSLCSSLVTPFRLAATERVGSMRLIKTCVTLIDFCSGFAPLAALESARDVVASILHPADGGLSVASDNALAALSNDAQPWPLGLSRRLSVSQQRVAAAEILRTVLRAVAIFVRAEDLMFHRIVFLSTSFAAARALGRAIGLALLYGAGLAHWRLQPAVVQLLHARQRPLLADSMACITTAIGTEHVAQFLQMAFGVDDVLSPGGHEIFTTTEWSRRFGLTDIHSEDTCVYIRLFGIDIFV